MSPQEHAVALPFLPPDVPALRSAEAAPRTRTGPQMKRADRELAVLHEMRHGSPGASAHNAFAFLDMGYGSTLAWAMFIVVLVLTVALFKTQSRWVYYAGGND